MMVKLLNADSTISTMLHFLSPIAVASWAIVTAILSVLLRGDCGEIPDAGVEELGQNVGNVD